MLYRGIIALLGGFCQYGIEARGSALSAEALYEGGCLKKLFSTEQ